MKMKNDLEELKTILTELKVPYRHHSWTTMPSAHRFATWFVPQMRFEGHDLRAEYYHYTVQISVFYRSFMDETDDFAFEESFEQACRDAGSWSKKSGYDNERDLFWSEYIFEFTELYEE